MQPSLDVTINVTGVFPYFLNVWGAVTSFAVVSSPKSHQYNFAPVEVLLNLTFRGVFFPVEGSIAKFALA